MKLDFMYSRWFILTMWVIGWAILGYMVSWWLIPGLFFCQFAQNLENSLQHRKSDAEKTFLSMLRDAGKL